MAKLPAHGVALDAEGRMTWGWSHNDPDTEFESFPPVVHSLKTGEFKRLNIAPDAAILDLEEHFDRAELTDLFKDRERARWQRTSKGQWELKQLVGLHPETKEPIFVEHPVAARRAARVAAESARPAKEKP